MTDTNTEVPTTSEESPTTTQTLRNQLQRLRKVQEITAHLGLISELDTLTTEMVKLVSDIAGYGQVVLLTLDTEGAGLKYVVINTPETARDDDSSRDSGRNASPKADPERLKNAYIKTFNSQDERVNILLAGDPVFVEDTAAEETPLHQFGQVAGFKRFFALPMIVKEALLGVLVIEMAADQALTEEDRELLPLTAANAAVILQNARQHDATVKQLASKMHEMSILQQIDRELNDTIALNTVFNMTLDWALRFTNANAASISLYDEDSDNLRTMFNYGYQISDERIEELRGQSSDGIAYRVARTGRSEVVPDVAIDGDYHPVEQDILSQLAVPVLREDRVIAVITLESKKINAFDDEHLEFVKNLANRAAVAIDNARLYTESEREREKLSHILSNILDIVIVIGPDERIVLMNQSAVSALRLYTDTDYAGQPFTTAINFNPLIDLYQTAKTEQESQTDELTLPNNRVFYTKADHHEGIGWIIVMQDVTPYKEMDKLKGELIATVSHDLKQPLSVMRGYLDLLQMKNQFDNSSENFINMIDKSIINMRQLIDDLLDLARIESGIDLKLEQVSVKALLDEIIEINHSTAINKSMTVIPEIPDNMLMVSGEESRLNQIFHNLIGNAIKYTPPEGEVRVTAEIRGSAVRVAVQDNGLGISPEDQAHIFERFYRVRRPETESIDGTGLGLAIVKSLVEAHQGTIRLESTLGKGSTFYVTLPLNQEDTTPAPVSN